MALIQFVAFTRTCLLNVLPENAFLMPPSPETSSLKLGEMPCVIKLVPVDDQKPPEFWEPELYEHLVRAASAIERDAQLLVLLGGDAGCA